MSVVIISNKQDASVEGVVDWLAYYAMKFYVLTYEEFVTKFAIKKQLKNGIEKLYFYDLEEGKDVPVTGLWYRRNSEFKSLLNLDCNLESSMNEVIHDNLKNEIIAIKRIFWNASDSGQIKYLSSYETFHLDKYKILCEAMKVGLFIPDSIVTNSKKILTKFISKYDKVICKSASENLVFSNNLGFFMQYVKNVEKDMLENLEETFFPSFFQQHIENAINIRAFYLDGKFYSTALIQDHLDYRIDFANRRTVPFNLPDAIKQKTTLLMEKLSFNIGGIDFMLSKGKFYFLEVNPNGYFGKNSSICNFNLDKIIAEFFCKL